MARNGKTLATAKAPDYSTVRTYIGECPERDALGFTSTHAFVAALNKRLVQAGRLPVSCGDYPSSLKNLKRLVKRWQTL